jgi:hypothetical protein
MSSGVLHRHFCQTCVGSSVFECQTLNKIQMKQMMSVRSNAYYTQEEGQKEFALNAMLELVIIHTDGKNYKLTKNDIESSPKLAECRLIVSPEMIQHLITDLQLHQKKLEGIRKNADQLNSLVRHITSDEQGS